MSNSVSAISCFFFFNDTATTEIYTLSLHDALPILGSAVSWVMLRVAASSSAEVVSATGPAAGAASGSWVAAGRSSRSEEHTSELQSRQYLVCRLLLEKKKTITNVYQIYRTSTTTLC